MADQRPIDDRIDVAGALDMVLNPARPRPMATCPADGEPLISTFERRGAEFLCMTCGAWFGFLAPTPAEATAALEARHAELHARFKAGERP